MGPDLLSPDLRPALVQALAAARTHSHDLKLLGQVVIRNSEGALGVPAASRETDLLGGSCAPMVPTRAD